ncbi:MAG: flagellar hook-associated protein 3 [Gallionellales bacterium RIFCSPHIGHO2_02_FULL_57_16]|nr:MAG: flagellar hook-associated protein 3 [Gallionellales bacterium RIFCSPHIGHO2_02_FULL_57_16]
MRVSSNTIFDSSVATLNQQQARLLQTQRQIASGSRILTASDDPVAATRALEISQSDAANTQYASNRDSARNTLTIAESTLQAVTSLIRDVQTSTISAGNGSLNSSGRKVIATDLTARLQELLGLANSTDGLGNYLFAGFQSRTKPFVDTAAGVGFFGDDGQHLVQVAANRQMASSDSGADVFMRIKNGNGTFVTQPAAANTGSGVVSSGSVTNPALLTGNNYSVSFSVEAGAPPVTTYDVTNTTTGFAVAGMTAQPYVSGQAISFDGIQLDIKGGPANGDIFTVTPSTNESLFATISDLINALNSPVVGANLTNSLSHGLNNLDKALNNVLTVQATMGLRLNELDALQIVGDDMSLQFKQTLSKLQDTDYNKAASDLARQTMGLQAAQQTFVKVAGLSLLDYL